MTNGSAGLKMGLAGLGLLIAVTGTVAWMTLVDAGEGNGPATADGANTGSGSRALKEYLDSLIDPLRQAAIDHGEDPGVYIPEDGEIQTAIATGSMESQEYRTVIAQLREGYDHYLMRFPGPPADGDGAGVGQESDRISAEDRQLPMAAWFELRILALQEASRTQGRLVDEWLPAPEELQRAVESGTLDSEASLLILAGLRDGYAALGMAFQEPL